MQKSNDFINFIEGNIFFMILFHLDHYVIDRSKKNAQHLKKDSSNNINKIITHLNYLQFLPFLLILTTVFPFAIVDFRDYSSLLLY